MTKERKRNMIWKGKGKKKKHDQEKRKKYGDENVTDDGAK